MELIKLTGEDLRYIVNESVRKAITETSAGKPLNLDTLVSYLSMPYEQKALNNAVKHFDDYCSYLNLVKKLSVKPSRKAALQYRKFAVEYTDRLLKAVKYRSPYILNGDIDVRWQNSNLFIEYLGRTSGWLVHFTNHPRDIVEQGFLGLQDMDSIHRTFGYIANRQLNSGYAFAYDANTLTDNDFAQNVYYVVFFQGEGIVTRNLMDRDEQVIFDAATADHTNVVVGKLSKKIEADYDGNGEIDTTSSIDGLQLIYPASVKGMSFSNVREAFSWLHENGVPDMTQQSRNDDAEAVIEYFNDLPETSNPHISKGYDDTYIHYYSRNHEDEPLVATKHMAGPVRRFIESLGFTGINTPGYSAFRKGNTVVTIRNYLYEISVEVKEIPQEKTTLNESVLLEELLRASNIITLSPYRQGNMSTVCHNMKEKGVETSYQELRQLAVKIKQHYGDTKGLVVVPIPSRSGYSEEGAKFISDMLGARFCPCIGRNPGQSLYSMKKSGIEVSEKDTGFYLKSAVPNGNILLFDNVIATGTSLSSALRLLGRPCDIACLAVDYETYKD